MVDSSFDYYISVEEFIPCSNVNYMLRLAENLEGMEPVEAKRAFKDIKRTMVWMERYIAPTSEFWEWSTDSFDIDGDTILTVQLIGFGWIVAVTSKRARKENDLGGEEKRLINIMNRLTHHIPVKAVLRLKSSRWTKNELEEVASLLQLNTIICEVDQQSLNFPALKAKLYTEPDEKLEFSSITRNTGQQLEKIIAIIKEYANRKNEGAGWCAYQRRRLTLVHKIGSEEVTPSDLRFIAHPEYGMQGEVITSRVKVSNLNSATFCFYKAKYHTGNIHPRALIASPESLDGLKELTNYAYYLWNSHFTRIWLYLLFEDKYAYADNLLSSRQYVDPQILHYWQNLLKTDEILADMHRYERIDTGQFQSYHPPHDKFVEESTHIAGFSSEIEPIKWLRSFLIEASTTQLYKDPLKGAVVLLEDLDEQMKTALNLFVQTVEIKMQRTLQILQFLFIIAALSQLIQLIWLITLFFTIT